MSGSDNAALRDRCRENLAMLCSRTLRHSPSLTQNDSRGRHRKESQFPPGRSFHPRSCARLSHPSYIRVQIDSQTRRIPNRAPGTESPEVERQPGTSLRARTTTKSFPRAPPRNAPHRRIIHAERTRTASCARVFTSSVTGLYIELIGVVNIIPL